ncbi:Eco57I restriction-modification methylase domain-containing protein [Rathayibacter sp. VKM Ac-2805]|uniref:Eco57I restriction-modification methylase domain-containing protein n=1 Tax=Rathayibacter sp. VKM Ac-2805 TaxID=2609258 RepID=UPI0013202586|nr:Eco57I restriction-modification methylase domain-containing protein [Rathayibacter sp. VKM Ac-2805]QHC72767.1 hypothetical protein GSU40_02970 [Rathayibacter sp. VKM Ac-2805]
MNDLILGEVTTFDDLARSDGQVRTVILRCESEDLEWLSYKPDFPDSVFHFTIYDGPSSDFAWQVLQVMKQFPWNLRIIGAEERVEPYEKSRGSLAKSDTPVLSDAAGKLLSQLKAQTRIFAPLVSMSREERLRLVSDLCKYIHNSSEVAPAGDHPIDLDEEWIARYAGQDQPLGDPTLEGFANQVPIPEEREAAMFLTPPELAYDMASASISLFPQNTAIDFGDPAVGPGIFFAALRKLARPAYIRSAVGVEISPARARATAHRWRRAGLRVLLGDFLTRKPADQEWNLLLANPPYVRHQEINRSLLWLRIALAKRIGVEIDGRSDLYVYFVLSAHDWLREGAIASWLLPSEFASTDFGQSLRTYFTNHVQLRRLHFYDQDSTYFDNARISSSVVTYERTLPSGQMAIKVTRGGTLERPVEEVDVPLEILQRRGKWNWLTLTQPYSSNSVSIGDYFDLKRGIATGANAAFVLRSDQLLELEVAQEWVRPVLPKARTLDSYEIEADIHGNPLVSDRRWLIDTDESISKIRSRSPKFADYLEEIEAGVGQRTLVRQRRPFYKQEKRKPADFVFVYMAKRGVDGRGRFIRNRSRAVVLNNYLALTMKDHLREAAENDDTIWAQVFDALRAVPSEEFVRHGRNYVSGLVKLEPRDLAEVRIGLPDRWLSTMI